MAKYNQPVYRAFIDYDIAFDSVETVAVMQALRNQVIDEPFVKIVEDICKDIQPPTLLTAYLQDVFIVLDCEQLGIRVNEEHLSNMRFAEDVALFSNSANKL